MRTLLLIALLARPSRAAPSSAMADANYWNAEIREPFFSEARVAGGRTRVETRRRFSRRAVFYEPKPPTTLRVFVLGGSVAAIYDSDAARSRGWTLNRILGGTFPGRGVEIVHCGMPAYDSYREGLVLDEVLRYEPDLVVLMSGNNESAPEAGPPKTRLRKLVGGAAGYVGRFEAALVAMVRKARGRGVAVALCTLPRQRGLPPPEPLPLRSASFARAWRDWESGRFSEAEREFRSYARTAPRDPFGPLCLGRCLERRGLAGEARRAYLEALRREGVRMPEINEIIRKTCRREGAILVDLERAFDAAAPGARNDELIYDAMHWNRSVDPLVSLTLARAVAASPQEAASADARWLERSAAEMLRLDPTADERRRIFDSRLQEAFWRADMDPRVFDEYSVALFELLFREDPKRLGDALERREELTSALSGNPWVHPTPAAAARCWAAGLGHAGEAYRRAGRLADASRCFARALRLDPALKAVAARLHPEAEASTLPPAAQRKSGTPDDIASQPPELKRALALFAKQDWDAGFEALRRAFPRGDAAARLDVLCAPRPKSCAPWRAARGRAEALARRARGDFEAGASSSSAREFSRLQAWLPGHPAARAGLAALSGGPPSEALELYSDDDLGGLAPGRDALARAFDAFGAGDWTAGFLRLRPATSGFSPDRFGDLESFCSRRPATCAPWRQAQDELRRRNDRGMQAFMGGDRAGAKRVFYSIRALMPNEPSGLVNLAVVASSQGDDRRALTLYGEALGLSFVSHSYRAEVLSARAAAFSRLGRRKEAISDLRRAAREAPGGWPRRREVEAELARLER